MSDGTIIGNFRKGAEEAKQAAKFVSFDRTEFFSLKEDGDAAVLRFLTESDQWIVVDQYQMVPTKPKPASYKGENFPKHMFAVSRSDNAFSGIFEDDYIRDVIIPATRDQKGRSKVKNAAPRTWALAVVREEVKKDGKVIGWQDATHEVQPTNADGKPEGKPIKKKTIVIVNQGWKNFFGTVTGFAVHYGTILDRDYKIVREGSGTATTYNILPLDPLGFKNSDGETITFDPRNREVADLYELEWDEGEGRPTGMKAGDVDLQHEVSFRASDKWYEMWFVPTSEDGKRAASSNNDSDDADDGDDGSGNDVDPSQLQELAKRVSGYSGGESSDEGGDGAAGMQVSL